LRLAQSRRRRQVRRLADFSELTALERCDAGGDMRPRRFKFQGVLLAGEIDISGRRDEALFDLAISANERPIHVLGQYSCLILT
jgi:hypothetical protein